LLWRGTGHMDSVRGFFFWFYVVMSLLGFFFHSSFAHFEDLGPRARLLDIVRKREKGGAHPHRWQR